MRVPMTLMALVLMAASIVPVEAQQAGRTCHIARAAGAAARPDVGVTIGSDPARTGEPMKLSWALRTKLDPKCRSPLYLIVHMHPQVRFAGEGFLALPPGVEAPYGIALARDRMRVLVPLHLGASTANGRIDVKPFAAGPLEIAWDVVEVPALVAEPRAAKDFARGKEVRGANGNLKIEVAQGQPHIVLQDRYAVEKAKRIVAHIRSGYELHDYGAHFRIVERASGLLVTERRGSDPRFSPTGRFVYYFGVPGIEPTGVDAGLIAKADRTQIEVVDLVSGERVAAIRPIGPASDRADTIHAAHWAMGDAFLALAIGNHVDRRVTVLQLLIDRRRIDKTCIVCDVEIDLDNTLTRYPAKRDAGQLFEVANPQGTLAFSDGRSPEGWRDPGLAKVFAPEKLAKLPADQQQSWNIEQDVATAVETAILSSHQVARGAGRLKLPLWDKTGFEDAGTTSTAPGTPPSGAADATRVLRAVRTASAVTAGSLESMSDAKSDRLVELLAEHGLTLHAAGKPSRHAGEAIAKALVSDIPKAAVVLEGADFWACRRGAADGDPVDANGDRIDKDEFERGSLDANSLAQALRFTAGGARIWLVATHCSHGTGRYGFGRLLVLTARDGGGETLHWLHPRTLTDNRKLGALLGLDDGRKLVASLSHDRYLLIATEGGGAVVVWDIVEGKLLHVLTGVGEADVPMRLALTANLRHLVQVNTDGTLRVHALVPGSEGVSGRYIDDELVLFDRQGYFTGTPEGAHHVFLKFPGVPGLATLHQYREALFRPDDVRALIANGQGTAPRPRLPPPPTVDFAIDRGSAADGGRVLALAATAASESALRELRVFIDGRLTLTEPLDGRRQSVRIPLDAPAAARWITAQAVDRQGLESAPFAIALPAAARPLPAAASRGTLHVLAVGTDTYIDPQVPPLALARSDARTFFEAARATAGHYHSAVTGQVLLDEVELKSILAERIARIAREASADDTIALFVAGHGVRDDKGRFHLATAKTTMADLAGTSIAFDEIAAALGGTKARVAVFLDACHAGAAGGLASNDEVAKAFLDRTSAITVIAAAKGRQLSEEHTQLAGGVFTRVLAEALADRARLDANGNGAIELSELYGRLKQRVNELTDGRQTPWIARNNMVGEIPLF